MQKIGLFGSCQLHACHKFFLNKQVTRRKFKIVFSLRFYEYNPAFVNYKGELNYAIFDGIDILIIENNNLDNQASSQKIIEYCKDKQIRIIKTFLIKFPIFPINWSGLGEKESDYLNWVELDKINYKKKFRACMSSCVKHNRESDLSLTISTFIKKRFTQQLLFTHSLHPTNVLLYELWRCIFDKLFINIDDYNYCFNSELVENSWHNPFTQKMMTDLNIQFTPTIDDNFYIDRYNKHKTNILTRNK